MLGSIESRVEAVKDKLTKTEKILANYLATVDGNDLIYQSITELSEQSEVGEATILRFCRKLGLKGYQEFKLVVAGELAKNNNNEDKGYFSTIADTMSNTILETKERIVEEDLNKAIDLLKEGHRKFFFGVGNSGLAALEAKNRLMRMGIHVDAVLDSHFQPIVASTLTEKDVIVLISVSGSTKDIIDVAEIAKCNGTKIIVITNYEKSPVAKYADVVLYSVRKETPLEGGSLVSKISQLYLIDVLCTGMAIESSQKFDEMKEKTARAVVSKIL